MYAPHPGVYSLLLAIGPSQVMADAKTSCETLFKVRQRPVPLSVVRTATTHARGLTSPDATTHTHFTPHSRVPTAPDVAARSQQRFGELWAQSQRAKSSPLIAMTPIGLRCWTLVTAASFSPRAASSMFDAIAVGNHQCTSLISTRRNDMHALLGPRVFALTCLCALAVVSRHTQYSQVQCDTRPFLWIPFLDAAFFVAWVSMDTSPNPLTASPWRSFHAHTADTLTLDRWFRVRVVGATIRWITSRLAHRAPAPFDPLLFTSH